MAKQGWPIGCNRDKGPGEVAGIRLPAFAHQ